jgi:hypothetical protein
MRGLRRPGRALAAAAVCVWAIALSACGLYRDDPSISLTPTPSHANLLGDPGFEAGDAWTADPASALSVDGAPPRSGVHAATLDSTAGDAHITQSIAPPAFPDFVSGYYRVPRWSNGNSPRFVGFSVTVRGGQFPDNLPQHTVNFVIAGLAAAPDNVPQGEAYVFLSRAAPTAGSWQYFGYPVKAAFITAFMAVPPTWNTIDVSFDSQTGAVAADSASFDDLYAGPQLSNPNRP